MSYSLNEVEVTAKRATRGAGFTWGLAEDTAKAIRWLCAHDLDGVGFLAGLLEQSDRDVHAPVSLDGDWVGKGALCPLRTGCLLSDSAHLLSRQPIVIQHVAVPALVLPFAALAARQLNEPVVLDCDGMTVCTDGQILSSTADWPTMAQTVMITTGGDLPVSSLRRTRASPRSADWDALNRFAHKTYAPATEESRLLGAGAGLSDND
ncbi:hypothetical protein TRL7639_02183 [Falsiruegeria litorea R37]|uniref:DUF3726 domain-containing protein n=1 Tax=Falsiruegeria litorea R37 TaxID=1200284 RepID=A0A1Y5SJW0_9RHOB|nr:DUF3726 domain-containing protein [Falsiruegeria litorea]SLN42512.1 hypothetical protein TRL7639_02183 [Falsiruegeria litorea R37]